MTTQEQDTRIGQLEDERDTYIAAEMDELFALRESWDSISAREEAERMWEETPEGQELALLTDKPKPTKP